MSRSLSVAVLLAAAAVLAAAGTAALTVLARPVGLLVAGFLVCWLVFALWPWSALPVSIIGGGIAGVAIGGYDVRTFIVVHVLALAAGALARPTRWLFGVDRETPRTGLVPGLAVVGVVGAFAVYGLAVGNAPMLVLVATYQVLVIPLYYFLTLQLLPTRRDLRQAAILFTVAVAALTAAQFTTPGRHGGLLSLLPVPVLIMLAGRLRGWRRAGSALLAAGLIGDVVLSSYRGVWIAGAIAVVLMLVRGSAAIRRGVLITLAAGAATVALLAAAGLTTGLAGRAATIGEALDRGAGYRVPEAQVGLKVFGASPLLGGGLGQTTPETYIPGFATVDVGPTYHTFYVLILANLGLVGLVVCGYPLLRIVRSGLARRDSPALAFAALTCGFLASAAVSSPTDGHWELGVLPALTVLFAREVGSAARPARPPLPGGTLLPRSIGAPA